jgi:NTE family protein
MMPGRREALAALAVAASARMVDAAATAHPRRIGLALSSGGLHGLVHVGVIRALQELRFRPHVIAGCSVGAIAGALWAAGLGADAIEAVALDTAWRQMGMSRLPRLGLSDQRRLQDVLEKRTGGARIEKLETRLGVVATDLATGRTVLLDHGALAPAVAASASVPILYEPIEIDGRRLVDGALTAPVPVDAARELGADVVIAVDVAYRPYEETVSGITGVAFQMFHIMVNQLISEQVRRADARIQLDVHSLVLGPDPERTLIRAGEQAVGVQWSGIRKTLGI